MSDETDERTPGLYLTLHLEELREAHDTRRGYGTIKKTRGIAAVTDQMLTAPVMGALLRAIADEIDNPTRDVMATLTGYPEATR